MMCGSFAISDVVFIATGNELATLLTAMLALIQVLVHSTRLVGWYHPNLWEKSLLWVLYLGYIWLIGGFLMKFLTITLNISPWIAVHAFGSWPYPSGEGRGSAMIVRQ